MKKLSAKIVCLLLPVLTVVVGINWLVDPANIKDDDSYESGVASLLLSGKNVASRVENFKERKLQKYIVRGLSKSPDVIVLGSSRSMEIRSTLFPGKSFINNSVSGASIEDYLGIYDLYRRRNFRPKTVIIGLDPWVLNRNNGQQRWEDLNAEYCEMRSVLGSSSSSRVSLKQRIVDRLMPYWKYKEFISPAYFDQSLIDLITKKRTEKKYWAVDGREAEEPVRLADGSLVYGAKMRGRTLSVINDDARSFASTRPIYSLGKFGVLDPATMKLLQQFIEYLEKQGATVVFFLPPYHPFVYAAINADSSYAMVGESERWYRGLARSSGIDLVGSFDPRVSRLEESDFFDGMHAKPDAVKGIFDSRQL